MAKVNHFNLFGPQTRANKINGTLTTIIRYPLSEEVSHHISLLNKSKLLYEITVPYIFQF
jgi:hypothetical protein